MKSKIHPNPYFSKFNLRVSLVGERFTCKIKKIPEKNFGTQIFTDGGLAYQKVGVVICMWKRGGMCR